MSEGLRYRGMVAGDAVEPLARILSLAFSAPEAGGAAWLASIGHENVRLIESGGVVHGLFTMVPMGQFFGGRSVPMWGIAGVAVAPEARGRGVATFAMREAMRELHGKGVPLSTLFSAKAPLYRKVGFEFAGYYCEHRLPLARIELREGARASGVVRAYTEADRGAVEANGRKVGAAHPGLLDRGPYVWGRIINGRTDAKVHGFVIEEKGVVTGHVFYVHAKGDERSGPGSMLAAPDICATTLGAARTILSFLADHRSIHREVWWFGVPMDPLFAELADQPWTTRVQERWMVRLVDVPKALEARGYGAGVDARVVLRVRDDLIGENEGVWTLTVREGRGVVERGGDEAGAVTVDVRALSPMYSGMRSASQLAMAGQIEGDAKAVAVLDSVFAGAVPSVLDHF